MNTNLKIGNKMQTLSKNILLAVFVLTMLLLGVYTFFGIAYVEGHQMAMVETWNGVEKDPVGPGKHIYFRPTTDYIMYDMRVQSFVMNDKKTTDGEVNEGREKDAYQIEVGKGAQKIKMSLLFRWHYNPLLLSKIHQSVRNNVVAMNERIIRSNLMRLVKDKSTPKEALDIYSGIGLVNLQTEIDKSLTGLSEFKDVGIIADGFVIESIALDPKYEAEISLKQLAIQRAERMEKEAKANLQEAVAAEAKAQIVYKQAVVTAEKEKKVGILKKEQEKQEAVLTAQGKSEADKTKASGILEIGLAEAKVEQAKRDAAYVGEAGFRRAAVEIAQAKVGMFKDFRAVVPEKTALTMIDKVFADSIRGLNVQAQSNPE
jgi:hypothetical protein